MDWASDKHADRIESLDLYRGILVSLMILSNYFSYLKAIPSSFKHASPGAGITIIDFGVPLFFFVLGVSYVLSLEKRLVGRGMTSTVSHFVLRYALMRSGYFFHLSYGDLLSQSQKVEHQNIGAKHDLDTFCCFVYK